MPKNPVQLLKYRMSSRSKSSSCILVFGAKGKGKSWLALRLSELIDPYFNLDKVKFNPVELFKYLNEHNKPGMCILYDEAGVGSNARDAQTRLNKHMSFIAQSVRPKRITIFLIAPSWKLVDSQVRSLMDYAIKVEKHDKFLETTQFKFFKVVASDLQAEPLRKHLVFNDKNGRPVKHISWLVHSPSTELGEGYNKLRDGFSDTLVKDAAETGKTGKDIRFGGKEKKKEKPTLSLIAKEVASNPQPFMIDGRLEPTLIGEYYRIGMGASAGVVRLVKALLPTSDGLP